MDPDSPDQGGESLLPLEDPDGETVRLVAYRNGEYTCIRPATAGQLARYRQRHRRRARREEMKERLRDLSQRWSRDKRMSLLVTRSVLPVTSFTRLERAVRNRVSTSRDGSALVSMVFCRPDSLVFRDLRRAYAYFDRRSGPRWDLFFAGYEGSLRGRSLPPSVAGIPLWRFSPEEFLEIRESVEFAHRRVLDMRDYCRAMKSGGLIHPWPYSGRVEDVPAGLEPWRYSGMPELVSVMAYRDLPGLFDWPSLHAVTILDAQGAYRERSLGQIVEIMSDWRDDDNEALRDLAPGEAPISVGSVLSLERALAAIASAIAAGVAGNAAYELLKSILKWP